MRASVILMRQSFQWTKHSFFLHEKMKSKPLWVTGIYFFVAFTVKPHKNWKGSFVIGSLLIVTWWKQTTCNSCCIPYSIMAHFVASHDLVTLAEEVTRQHQNGQKWKDIYSALQPDKWWLAVDHGMCNFAYVICLCTTAHPLYCSLRVVSNCGNRTTVAVVNPTGYVPGEDEDVARHGLD